MTADETRIALTDSRWKIIFAAWTAFGLAQIALAALMLSEWRIEGFYRSFVFFMPRVWCWSLLTPLISLWDRKVRSRATSLPARVALHFPLFFLTCLVQAVIRRTSLHVLDMPVVVPFYVTVLFFADIEAVRYVASLMLGRVLDASRELVRRDRRTAALKEEIAQAQLHFLDLQLQPHFLFNALGSIAELAHEAPAAAARMVDHLMSLLRYATQSRTAQEVTLREELAALDPYLQIQRMRFPDWLSISERIDPAAGEALVPRMLLQPLVENAIRHGLSQRQSGGVIVFSASVESDDLVISVYDNGAGLGASSGSSGLGIGLGNIRERLATLYGNAQSLELLNHDVAGVEVILRIPFRRASAEGARESASRETIAPEDEATPGDEEKSPTMVQLAGGWLLAGALLTCLSLLYIFIRHPAEHEPLMEILRRHVIHAGLWIVLTPIVFATSKKLPISRENRWYTVPLHIVAGAFVALAHVQGSRILVGGSQPPLMSSTLMDALFWNLAAYGVILGISQRAAIEGWIRERDLAAARMRAELTTARLSTIMLELRPEFLLSALASVRALVTVDVQKAEALLTSFADFLRLTMESLTKKSMSLDHDIALVSAYAKVHDVAAGRFPEIGRDVPASLENATVPTGLTRALVEQIVDSGNIPESVLVQARRNDSRLSIWVTPSSDNDAGGSASAAANDPFGRLRRLTESGAVIRFDKQSSSIIAEIPLSRGGAHVAEKPGSLALRYG